VSTLAARTHRGHVLASLSLMQSSNLFPVSLSYFLFNCTVHPPPPPFGFFFSGGKAKGVDRIDSEIK
jgi:hypothetical protein